jgi:hypothetical protein
MGRSRQVTPPASFPGFLIVFIITVPQTVRGGPRMNAGSRIPQMKERWN